MKKIIRKIRSFIKKIISIVLTLGNHIQIFLLEENIFLGKNITIGKGTIIKTTDGGKITIEDNVSIESNCYIYAQFGEITIGKKCFIGAGVQIVALKSIKIEADCLVSAYCIIRDANHGMKKEMPVNAQSHNVKEIVIEDDVWLGAHCVITRGSRIGQGAVVGANAVVTKDIASYTVVGGVPAKFIKNRD